MHYKLYRYSLETPTGKAIYADKHYASAFAKATADKPLLRPTTWAAHNFLPSIPFIFFAAARSRASELTMAQRSRSASAR